MNVKLNPKPGVRTSLNSNNNIRDNFGSDKNKSGVAAPRNSAASSAAQNLSNMSLVSGNWNSKSGSILNNNSTPARAMNNRQQVGASWDAPAQTRSPKQGQKIDQNYVGAARTQTYVRDKYPQIKDFSFSRIENETGYGGRGLQRLQDAAYNRGAYSPIDTLNQVQSSGGMPKIGKGVAIGVGAAIAVGGGIALWNLLSKGKAEGTDGGSVSQKATANIKNMESAKDSATLGKAITDSKADLASVKAEIPNMEKSLTEANGKKSKLEADYKSATEAHTQLTENIKTQEGIVKEQTTALSGAKTNYESAKSAYDNAPADPADVKADLKTKMDEAKQKMDDIQAKIDAANAELEKLKPQLPDAEGKMKDAKEAMDANQKVIDETPAKIKDAKATVASYEKEIPKQEKRLEKMQKSEDKDFNKLYDNGVKGKNKDKDTNKLNNLAQTIAARSAEDGSTYEEVGGKGFAKIATSGGDTRFLIDGVIVTEEEYNTQLEAAKNPPIAQNTLNQPDNDNGVNFA